MRLPRGEFTKWIGVLEAVPSRTADARRQARMVFVSELCHIPPQTLEVNTVIYEEMSTRIDVA